MDKMPKKDRVVNKIVSTLKICKDMHTKIIIIIILFTDVNLIGKI